jgi:hypothetical protein
VHVQEVLPPDEAANLPVPLLCEHADSLLRYKLIPAAQA